VEIWQAIVLGIVQGLTEFLPISSSGHLVIFPWLLDWETPGLAFDAALHLGTLLAVIAYFFKDIVRMVKAIPYALTNSRTLLDRSAEDDEHPQFEARLGWLIAIATLPGLVAGILLQGTIDDIFHADEMSDRAIATIATMLIVVGIVLWLAERVATRRAIIGNMRWTDSLMIGAAQALALIPGTSRSGATITAGLFRGLTRADAARFSFLAGMPLVLAAGLKSVYDAVEAGMSSQDIQLFLAGGISAALVGFLTIFSLLRFLQRNSTTVFVIYRIAFGLFLFSTIFFR
jgi:undecaprenyl-diphosphatase